MLGIEFTCLFLDICLNLFKTVKTTGVFENVILPEEFYRYI
jgi:hypothetical protein